MLWIFIFYFLLFFLSFPFGENEYLFNPLLETKGFDGCLGTSRDNMRYYVWVEREKKTYNRNRAMATRYLPTNKTIYLPTGLVHFPGYA